MSAQTITNISQLSEDDQLHIGRALLSTSIFGKTFLPHMCYAPFNELHQPILEKIDGPGPNTAIAAPRGLGKTTLVTAFILRKILSREFRFIIYCSATETSAMLQTENVKNELSSNQLISALFGRPEVNSDTMESEGFSKNSWVAYGDTIIMPRGVGQQIRGLLWRGHRPDLIIFDDLEDRESVQSDVQRAKLSAWFYADAYATGSAYKNDMRRVYIDTVKHEACFLGSLLTDPEWDSIRLEACDDDFNPTAPGYKTREQLISLYNQFKRQGRAAAFMMEYRNRPGSELTATFKKENFQYCDITREGICIYTDDYRDYKLKVVRGQQLLTTSEGIQKYKRILPSGGYITLVIIDPAKTIEPTSAESGIVVVSVSPVSPYAIVRYAFGERLTPGELVERGVKAVKTFNARYLCVEITSLNLWASVPFRTALEMEELSCELVEVQARGKKEYRIATLAPYYEQGIILHIMEKTGYLEKQLQDFPYSKLVDVSDALGHLPGILNLLNFSWSGTGMVEGKCPERMPDNPGIAIQIAPGLMYVPKEDGYDAINEEDLYI